MKKTVFIAGLCILIFLSEITIGQESIINTNKLTFEQALLITKQNSLIMKQAKEHTQQKKLERQATKGLFNIVGLLS